MTDTGFVLCGTGANKDTGAEAWSSPGSITASDGSSAQVFRFTSGTSTTDMLAGSNYGLSVPGSAISIDGIEVRLHTLSKSVGIATVAHVNIGKDDSTLGTAKTPGTTVPNAPGADVTYGATNDLWGLSWTPAEINASTFQARFDVLLDGLTFVVVDSMLVRVTYTLAASQNLTPGRVDNTNVFYAPVVSSVLAGNPGRLDNTNVFYAPVVTRGAVTMFPDRFNNVNIFYSPVVTTGTAILLPGRLENINTFYSPSVAQNATQNVAPARLENVNIFFSPTVSQPRARRILATFTYPSA